MTDFHGMAVGSCDNGFVRLDYLKEAGPRIVRLLLGDSPDNLLAEAPHLTVSTEYGPYHFYGGHRLWHAPEALPRSYIPDDTGLDVQLLADGVRLTQPVETQTGVRKSMEIYLYEGRAALNIQHRLENAGLLPLDLAPWAITQLRLGGVAVIPQQEGRSTGGLLPDRKLVIWPYTRLRDPRLQLDDDFILVEGQAGRPACKIGTYNQRGWSGYLLPGLFFCKRFTPRDGEPHVDQGCNHEVYVDDRLIEVETLGALTRLQPGESVSHTETWEITAGLDYPLTADGVRALAGDFDLP